MTLLSPTDSTDSDLLQAFIATRSPDPFRQLVDRHLPTIHSAATRLLRRTRPPLTQHADDIAQSVFILLAQHAAQSKIPPTKNIPLVAWLYQVTHYACSNLQRIERRRQKHEQEAAAMQSSTSTPPTLSDAEALLDPALLSLSEPDRTALLLRYTQNLSVEEIATLTKVPQETAKKRLHRALTKLRKYFASQGMLSATPLALHALTAAPTHAALAATITTTALAPLTAAAAKTTSFLIAKGVTHMLNLAKFVKAASIALVLSISLLPSALIIKAATPPPPAAAPADAETTAPFNMQWTFRSQVVPGNANQPPGRISQPPALSDPVVNENVLYFADGTGVVRALNAKDGHPIWSMEYGTRIDTVAVDNQRLYVTSRKGIAALDPVRHMVTWDFDIPQGAESSSIAIWPATESLFVGGNDGLVYALDRRTGKKIWTHDMLADAPPDNADFPGASARIGDHKARPTGIVTDGKCVYQSIFDQSRVIALDCQTGKQLWAFQAGGWILGSAAWNDDYVFVGSQDKAFFCIDKKDGSLVWHITTRNRIESTPTLLGPTVCVASCDGMMYCVDIATGKLAWTFQTDLDDRNSGPIYSKAVQIENTLYFAAGEGQVYALDAATGNLRWKLRPAPDSQLLTSPATDGSRIFLTSRQAGGGGRSGGPPTGEASIITLAKDPR